MGMEESKSWRRRKKYILMFMSDAYHGYAPFLPLFFLLHVSKYFKLMNLVGDISGAFGLLFFLILLQGIALHFFVTLAGIPYQVGSVHWSVLCSST